MSSQKPAYDNGTVEARPQLTADELVPHGEDPYRFLAEALPQIVWIGTVENRIIYINSHWYEYTGLTLEETQAGGWAAMIHPDDIGHAVGAAASGRATDGLYKAEYRLRRADGVWRWHLARASIVRMPDGSECWLGTAIDIDDRKHAEQERARALERELTLRRQAEDALAEQRRIEQKLLLLVEASGALIASTEPDLVLGNILDLAQRFVGADAYAVWRREKDSPRWNIVASSGLSNSYSASVTGAPALPHAPLPIEDVESDPLVAHRIDVYRGEGIRSMLTVPLVIEGVTHGTITFYYRAPHRFNEIETRVAGGLANLAASALGTAELHQRQEFLYRQSQQAQEALSRSNMELRRVNDDVNQFAFSASHDLREPLRMVAIYNQMLAAEYAHSLDETAQQYIRYSVQGAHQMEMLIRDILAYTTAASVVDEPTAVTPMKQALDKVRTNLEAAIVESGARIEAAELPELIVHEVHLVQLLQNLISNAIKYRSLQKPRIVLSAERLGPFWQISVRDNGIGIAPAYWNQIFRIFKRLHSASTYPGTGVGLAICQKIVERYGGTIRVESEEGKGATFIFTLPAADPAPAPHV